MSSNRHRSAGFTLIEVLMALVVFALLSMTVLLTQGLTSRQARHFFESFEDAVEVRRVEVRLEREQRLNQKEKFESSEPIPISYQLTGITQKSELRAFAKVCSIGLFEVTHRDGSINRSFVIVPLPIEKSTPVPKGKEQPKPAEKQAEKAPAAKKPAATQETATQETAAQGGAKRA